MNIFKRITLRLSDKITVNSDFTYQKVIEICKENIAPVKIPMGVTIEAVADDNLDKVATIRKKHKKGSAPLLIYVGRLVREKGVSDIFKAVSVIKKDIPDVQLIIAGDGQDKEYLVKLSNKLNLTANVTFLGWVCHEEIPLYLSAADFFIGLSKKSPDGWTEAQGLTFLEAMAAGSIVIATASGGINETVVNGVTGFIAPEKDYKSAANIVCKAHLNKQNLDEIKNNALNFVTKNYDRKKSAQKFIKTYQDIILNP